MHLHICTMIHQIEIVQELPVTAIQVYRAKTSIACSTEELGTLNDRINVTMTHHERACITVES
jgi:hypothetical protein